MTDVENYGSFKIKNCTASHIKGIPSGAGEGDIVLKSYNDAGDQSITATFAHAATPTLSFSATTGDNNVSICNVAGPEEDTDAVNSKYRENMLKRCPNLVFPTSVTSWGAVPSGNTFTGTLTDTQIYSTNNDFAKGFAFINIPINKNINQYFEIDLVDRGLLSSGLQNFDRLNLITGVITKEAYHGISATNDDWVTDSSDGLFKDGSGCVGIFSRFHVIPNQCNVLNKTGTGVTGNTTLDYFDSNNADYSGWLNQGLKIQTCVNMAGGTPSGGAFEVVWVSNSKVVARKTISTLSFNSNEYYFMIAINGGHHTDGQKFYNSSFVNKLGYYTGFPYFTPSVYIQ